MEYIYFCEKKRKTHIILSFVLSFHHSLVKTLLQTAIGCYINIWEPLYTTQTVIPDYTLVFSSQDPIYWTL